ncbi:MAG: YtxH domain-containing protein [Gemmatimonadales bacterium]
MGLRDDREITVVEADGSAGVKWFLFGAVLGAGLGLLFAPQSGEHTRRDISKRARRLKAEAEDRFDELTDEIETRGKKLKATVEDWADDVKGEVRDGRRAVQETAAGARDDLERRLSEARARRRATIAADGVAEDDDDDDSDA